MSWICTTVIPGWVQNAYELEIDGIPLGRTRSDASVFVPWPGPPLTSRSRHGVRVRVWGSDGSASHWSDRVEIEAGLLDPEDWTARWISPVVGEAEGRPSYFRRPFTLAADPGVTIDRARLYATSAGINELRINGEVVGTNVLAPGWSAYVDRLRYETHDVTDLVTLGENAVGAVVADGWWRGFLTWEMKRDVYGDRLGLLAQLEITYSDGSTASIGSDATWVTAAGPVLHADLYNGESYDARLAVDGWASPGFDQSKWSEVEIFAPLAGVLVAPIAPPVQRIEERSVQEVIVTPSGRTILDFGQNLVGWMRFSVEGEAGTTITLHHAEVLEAGELGIRPLRNAKATDQYTLRGGGIETWEPTFTFHGFRYVQVDGWPASIDPAQFVAVVIHSDFPRTGTFSCSNDLLNRLHENAVWGHQGKLRRRADGLPPARRAARVDR